MLLPIHEQGLLFARFPERIPGRVGIALPSFSAYWTALDKARFSRLLRELGIAQPQTQIVADIMLVSEQRLYADLKPHWVAVEVKNSSHCASMIGKLEHRRFLAGRYAQGKPEVL